MYRAAELSPMQCESAGKRRDGTISEEGTVTLRWALIDRHRLVLTGPVGRDQHTMLLGKNAPIGPRHGWSTVVE